MIFFPLFSFLLHFVCASPDTIFTIGIDEDPSEPIVQVFTDQGFSELLGWNSTQISSYKQQAIIWFRDRFGIDFSNAFEDPTNGVLILPGVALLVPVYVEPELDVYTSTTNLIKPTNKEDKGKVGLTGYIVIFSLFGAPTYGGTYANNQTIIGNFDDALSYTVYVYFKNRSDTKDSSIIYCRSYFPNILETQFQPPREVNRFQMYSEDFGPGFALFESASRVEPNGSGKFPTHIFGTFYFPPTNLYEIDDMNRFNSTPI